MSLSAEQSNQLTQAIYAAMDGCLGDRKLRPGAKGIWNSIYEDCRRRARLGMDPIFDLEYHGGLLTRFSEEPAWKDPAKQRREFEQMSWDVRSVVSRVLTREPG